MQPILILTLCGLTLCGTGAAAGEEMAAPDHLPRSVAHHHIVPKTKAAKPKPQTAAAPVVRRAVPDAEPGAAPEAALPQPAPQIPHQFSVGGVTITPGGFFDLTTGASGH